MTLASYRKSFLDELLYSDNFEKIEIPKKSKSVRFIDNQEDQASNLKSFSSSSDINKEKTDEKLNWLGINESEIQKNSNKVAEVKHDDKEEWFNQAPSEIEKKNDKEKEIDGKFSNQEDSWLNLKKKIQDTKKFNTTLDSNAKDSRVISNKDSVQNLYKNIDSNLQLTNSMSNEMTTLQAKIDALETEKRYLTSTIEKIESNHAIEMNALKTSNEKQMTIMSEALKRQEKILREEREKDVQDWKKKIETIEKEKENLQLKYVEKVSWIEKDCQFEIEKLREIHNKMLKHLNEGYEQDLERIKKLKISEIEILKGLNEQNVSFETLLQKWQENAQNLTNLHSSLSLKQDEILDQNQKEFIVKNLNFTSIEKDWKIFKEEMEQEKIYYQDKKEKLAQLITDLKDVLQNKQKVLEEERSLILDEKKMLEEKKLKEDMEIRKTRETLKSETKELNENLVHFEKKSSELESKQKLLSIKEIDFEHHMVKQKEELNQIISNIEFEKSRLEKEKFKLKQAFSVLEIEQKRFESKKLLFVSEKEKLKELANRLQERVQQLESVSEMICQKREEEVKFVHDSEKFKKELEQREKIVEKKSKEVNQEKLKLEKERQKLFQDLKILQEQRSLLICNLCGNSLNRIKISSKEFPTYPSLSQATFYPNFEENDRALLIWQINAKQDALLLEEETAFINNINNYNWSQKLKESNKKNLN